MANEFMTAYCENLRRLGFGVIAGDDRCAEVQSVAGQAANLGVVIDADAFAEDGLRPFIDEYSARIAARAEGARVKNIFVVYILLTGRRRADIDELMDRAEAFDGQRIYNIYWAVTPSAGTLDHNKDQPGEVGGMARALAATLRSENVADAIAPRGPVFLTYILIALNGAVFALMGMVLPADDPYRVITAGAIVPELVLGGQYWRLAAAMFIHFDVMHLAANCLSLYVFGGIVERFLGVGRFAAVYFASGLFASVLCLTQPAVSAGASGAVYGLIGAAAVVTWRSRGRAGLNFYNMAILIAVGIGVSLIVPGISYTAHIGGLAAGLALGWLLSGERKPQA